VIVVAMLAMIVVPAAITLHTVHFPARLVPTSLRHDDRLRSCEGLAGIGTAFATSPIRGAGRLLEAQLGGRLFLRSELRYCRRSMHLLQAYRCAPKK
jgi:hypothetical protein